MSEIKTPLTPNEFGGPEVLVTLEAADIKVVAIWDDGNYQVTIYDVSGLPAEEKQHTAVWTPLQFAAVAFLFIDNETANDELTETFYTIAEEVCGKLSTNLRPIP